MKIYFAMQFMSESFFYYYFNLVWGNFHVQWIQHNRKVNKGELLLVMKFKFRDFYYRMQLLLSFGEAIVEIN
jgi:hypothetical protein